MLSGKQLQQELFAPARHLVDLEALHRARVGVVGCGGVGSHAACHFARSGVGELVLWDADTASPRNAARSVYGVEDFGQQKALGLQRHIKSANPFARVVAIHGNLMAAPQEAIVGLTRRCSATLVAVDDFRVHDYLNTLLYHVVETVYTYVTDSGNSGEIIRTHPSQRGCVRCLTNYEARLRAGVARDFQALGIDFQRVALEAAGVVLGILLRDKRGGELFQHYLAASAHLFMVVTRRHGALAEALPAGWLSGTVVVDARSTGPRCPVCDG